MKTHDLHRRWNAVRALKATAEEALTLKQRLDCLFDDLEMPLQQCEGNTSKAKADRISKRLVRLRELRNMMELSALRIDLLEVAEAEEETLNLEYR